ncbi:MAG: HAD family phosphatase [Oscillibacter sp.]|jgi:HAD superfamily hydrolase (TIGR01509 family)|nr:HAD family phosphatase [Oscillibacter sp.]
MNKRFCIFDMDGTLVDSMVYWQRLGREFLADQGVTQNVDAVLERVKAMTITESAALFMQEFGLSGTPESIGAAMNDVMENHYRADIPLKPGVREYLDALHQAGAVLCVVSATKKSLVEACLRRLGVADDFAFFLSCEEVGAGKDRPDAYLEAAHRLGAAPSEIAVYEDAVFAAETAKAARFYTVGVYDPCGETEWRRMTALCDETIRDWRSATIS